MMPRNPMASRTRNAVRSRSTWRCASSAGPRHTTRRAASAHSAASARAPPSAAGRGNDPAHCASAARSTAGGGGESNPPAERSRAGLRSAGNSPTSRLTHRRHSSGSSTLVTLRQLRQISSYLRLESLHALRRGFDLLLAVDAKPQKLALPGTPRPALVRVHLQSQMLLHPAPDRLQHPLRRRFTANVNVAVSSPGESHPEALSEPYVNVSAHTAPALEPRRTPICQCAHNFGSRLEIRATQCVARRR